MKLSVVILAAGSGTRMQSKLPKVLHQLGGKPLLEHVIDTVEQLGPDAIYVVYGHMGEVVKNALSHRNVHWVEQKERLGTGHAVLQAIPQIDESHQVLILYGDVPLISEQTLEYLLKATGKNQLGLLTAIVDNPYGLGRIIRDQYQQVCGIVEEKDASDLQKQITEINTGIYCVPAKLLKQWLPLLGNQNAQGEYYLTDIVAMAKRDQVNISVAAPQFVEEIYGANSRTELAKLEVIHQHWQIEKLMSKGVSVQDPFRLVVRGNVTPARDCTIDVNVIMEGEVILGEDSYIGANTVLKNVTIGKGVQIKPNCVLEGAVIKDNAVVGPFARIRPDSIIEAGAHIGNFVEIKNSHIGEGSKINHLSYVGDAEVGKQVNIGAGTITCNYDGANKHKTIIGDEVFVGSNCALVAPITIGAGATLGAGSVISKDAPAKELTVARAKQVTVAGWQRPKKEKK
jgi:bifunctional UDP-N-acetylglucosamine pyrophosphorylase/glucosamine-1-phosphate N-acetyltransferase